ncbi:MAG: type II secretion system F family protein [Pseudomonadales bacterium]
MALELAQAGNGPAPTGSENSRSVKTLTNGVRKVTAKDRLFFTEQLAMLIDSGLATHQALELVARQTRHPTLGAAVLQIADDVAGGKTLSEAMAEQPHVFNSSYVRLIQASETGGYLSRVLAQLQHTDERLENLRRTLISAFTYPAILLVFSVLVVTFVLAYVFPKFSKLFVSLGDQLPITTRVLMGVSDMLVNYWYLVAAAAVAAIVLLRLWLRGSAAQLLLDRAKLTLPGLKSLCQRLYMSQTMQVMGLSLSNGVTVPETLRSCRDATQNRLLQAEFSKIEARIQEGDRLSEAFSDMEMVPELAKEMIATADEAGNLGQVANRIAGYYEDELNRLLERFSKIIEPIMLLVMGVVVGVLVSSLLLPVFKLSQVIR